MSRTSFVRVCKRVAVWLVMVLLAAEGVVRGVGFMLARDGVASPSPDAVGGAIYCIGDSFTYGLGVKREEAWPQVLARHLREDLGPRAPEVRTLAKPGRSSSGVLVEVDKVLKRGDAGLVLIMTGWNANDADFAQYVTERGRAVLFPVSVDLVLEHSHLYRVVKHAFTYRELTLALNDVKIVPLTYSMSPYNFRAYQEIAAKNLAHRRSNSCPVLSTNAVTLQSGGRGVRGAANLGMEPAYWWDALDKEVLNLAAIAFSSVANLPLLREWGQLRSRTVDPRTTPFKWYVLQNRPGMFDAVDHALIRSGSPAFVKFAGRRHAGAGVAGDLNVPLILVFSYEQYQRPAGR